MTDQADLERGYRRLLAWYPREFRRENGQEILAVLMAGARDGQRRPGLAESADLIRSGVRTRLRPSVPAVGAHGAGSRPAHVRGRRRQRRRADHRAGPYHRRQVAVRGQFLGHSLTAHRPLVITVWMVFGLTGVSKWLWMARANGQGRNWVRILSAVLFVLATLQLRGAFTRLVSHAGFGVTVLYYGGAVLFVAAWLAGGAAVWLLWRPASTAFFKPPGSTQALHQAHMAELDRLRSSRARSPRQV
jgi:hypothetical protein